MWGNQSVGGPYDLESIRDGALLRSSLNSKTSAWAAANSSSAFGNLSFKRVSGLATLDFWRGLLLLGEGDWEVLIQWVVT